VTDISADAVIDTLAARTGAVDHGLRENLRAIWGSVAADLKPEEACAVLWALHPGAVVGTSGHREAMVRLARSMYPADAPGRAVSRLRRVLARPSVKAVIDAMRAEEALFALAQRGTIREMLATMALTPHPEPTGVDGDGKPIGAWSPKDIVSHMRARLAAAQQWTKLDGLDAPPPVAEVADTEPAERRKKLLDKVKALVP